MNFEKMSLEELKEYAKTIELPVGNIGKEKLIEKIRAKENEKIDLDSDSSSKVDDKMSKVPLSTVLTSITSAIDELEVSNKSEDTVIENLPIDTTIRVVSITFGGLTYKSRINNAIFRWDNIGAEEFMTIAELNEMNNYKRDFLNRPLVILDDPRAVRKFRLEKIYENVARINDLDKVFLSDITTINATIDRALAVNMRDILISKVSQMIKKKSLVDINIIRILNKKLQYEFDELLEKVD